MIRTLKDQVSIDLRPISVLEAVTSGQCRVVTDGAWPKCARYRLVHATSAGNRYAALNWRTFKALHARIIARNA